MKPTAKKIAARKSAAALLGSAKSDAKTAAARENGAKGGRPTKPIARIYRSRDGWWFAADADGKDIKLPQTFAEARHYAVAIVRSMGYRPARDKSLDKSH